LLNTASDIGIMQAHGYFDIQARPIVVERRRTPDRRMEWRGGRRDADWLSRPSGALKRLETLHRRASGIRMFLASL
jgi:hypothetical protein